MNPCVQVPARLRWLSADEGGRRCLPVPAAEVCFGTVGQVRGWPEDDSIGAWTMNVYFAEFPEVNVYRRANVSFAFDEAPHQWLREGQVIELFEGHRLVAEGPILRSPGVRGTGLAPRFPLGETGDFSGEWASSHPWSVPSAYYGCDWNDMCLSAFESSPLILCDKRAEFIWRHPQDDVEESVLIDAMRTDVTACYNVDGLTHWTRASVARWRREVRPEIVAWASGDGALVDGDAAYQEQIRTRMDALLRFYEQDVDVYLDRLSDVLP